MGQPIVVTEKPSPNRGVVRFETNRALTGMGHERYLAGTEVWGDRPPDELARRLLTMRSVAGVQINSNVVTVDLVDGSDSSGLREIIENLYRFYPDTPAGAGGDAPDAPGSKADDDTAAPEAFADPADAVAPDTAEAPDPERDQPAPSSANPSSGPAPSIPEGSAPPRPG